MTDAIKERLTVAAEQISEVRRSMQKTGQVYRLDVANQAIRAAISLLETPPPSPNGYSAVTQERSDGYPIKVIWERPRKNQRFEGQLLSNGKIILSDGQGPFKPTAACHALVGGSTNGWIAWKYLNNVEEQEWLVIDELRSAGDFE